MVGEFPWSGIVRQKVYQLVALLILLGLAAVSYALWNDYVTRQVLRVANDYHLASNSHYLAAKQALRRTQGQLGAQIARKYAGDQLRAYTIELDREYDARIAYHTLRGSIRSGLELQQKYADPKVKQVSDKLLRHLHVLEARANEHFVAGEISEELIAEIESVIVVLEQLARLHSVMRQDLLFALENRKSQRIWVFFGLLLALLAFGVLATRRAFIAIDAVVDENHRMALAQKESDKRLQLAMSVANDGVWDWHLDTDEVIFDARYYTLSGYEPDAFPHTLGEFEKRIHPDDVERLFEEVYGYLSGERDGFEVEFRFLKKDGQFQWLRGRGKIVERRPDGSPLRFVGTHSDISERRVAEHALRRSQKMDAMGQLTGGIAHDFNNILHIILGNIDLLELDLPDTDKFSERLAYIRNPTLRAADLTKQLLSFSRRKVSKTQRTELNSLIVASENLITRSVTPQINVEHEFDDDLLDVDVDRGDFEDAFMNLILNAKDAMNGKGRITIETRNRMLDNDYCRLNALETPGEYVELSVSDTGIGMSAGELEHMFEPFYTTKEPGKGTGLGLPMVFGFVKRSRGHVKVYSEKNIGTTFRLYLPAVQGEADIAPVDSRMKVAEVPGGNEVILVVDDEADLLSLTQETLQKLGYEVFVAGDGESALVALAEYPEIQMLFSDVVMPEMNGFELAEKAVTACPELKVLLTSGYTEKAVARNGQARFNANLLSKPFSRVELAFSIRQTLDGEAGI